MAALTVAGRDDADPASQVYDECIAEAGHARTKKSLEALWATLQIMRRDGVRDYGPSRVGEYTEQHGGPRAQSIRNANGATFRKLIDAVAATEGKPRVKAPAHPPSNVELAIAMIPDMAARTLLKMIVEDRRRLQTRENELRTAFARLSVSAGTTDPKIPGVQQAEATQPDQQQLARAALSGVEATALRRFLSDDWLEERSWTIDPDGSIVDNTAGGDLVAPPGFVDGIQKALGS
jgi:hypothetical protein